MRCANTEAIDRYLAEQDEHEARYESFSDKADELYAELERDGDVFLNGFVERVTVHDILYNYGDDPSELICKALSSFVGSRILVSAQNDIKEAVKKRLIKHVEENEAYYFGDDGDRC